MIHANDLVKTFGQTVAVNHVSFDVAPGEIFAILGPKGERWVPMHGIMPFSRMKEFHDRLTRLYADNAERMRRNDIRLQDYVEGIGRSTHPPRRVDSTAVYLFSDLGMTPPPLLANLRHNEVLHETVLLVTVQWTTTPRVPRAKRVTVHELGEGFHQVLLRYGFMETPENSGSGPA